MAFDDRDRALMKWAYLQGVLDLTKGEVDASLFVAAAEIELENDLAEMRAEAKDET